MFSSIFAEDTIANSNYNSLQVSLEKRFSHGLQAQMAYTFSKSFDQASSFEGELNPLDPRGTYSLSQFDARHRLVFSYVWQLPIPEVFRLRRQGAQRLGHFGYLHLSDRLPDSHHLIRRQRTDVQRVLRISGRTGPDWRRSKGRIQRPAAATGSIPTALPRMRRTTPSLHVRQGAVFNCFDPSLFGQIGNAKRTICCGPPINNVDFALHKVLPVGREASALSSAPSSSTCSIIRSSTIRTGTQPTVRISAASCGPRTRARFRWR